MKKWIAAATVALVAVGSAWAAPQHTQTLIVSINKTVCPDDSPAMIMCQTLIDTAVDALNQHPNSFEQPCWVKADATEYIPYDPSEISYFGVALVSLTYTCLDEGQAYMDKVNANEDYTIWGNGRIEPFPGVSGSN